MDRSGAIKSTEIKMGIYLSRKCLYLRVGKRSGVWDRITYWVPYLSTTLNRTQGLT